MKIGIIGLPNSGKTTIFNALTRAEAEVTAYATTKAEPNLAVVQVDDERVTRLAAMYEPKKTIYATVECVDFPGVSEGAAKEGLFSSAAMGMIKTMEALALVVRNYADEMAQDAAERAPDPENDVRRIEEELLLSDLIMAENRLERIELAYRRGQKTNELQREEKVLRRIGDHLNENLPIRDLDLSPEEEKAIRGFQFVTRKPLLVVLNSSEDRFGKNAQLLETLGHRYQAIEFAGTFEMELALLEDPQEEAEFLADLGIERSARQRLTRAAHEILGYISFFTVGKDEVRAWNIRRGQNALAAAGTIHSDLARGFIRAECFTYADIIDCGSEKAVRDQGRFRLEGKQYAVQDGDILNIRFNV